MHVKSAFQKVHKGMQLFKIHYKKHVQKKAHWYVQQLKGLVLQYKHM